MNDTNETISNDQDATDTPEQIALSLDDIQNALKIIDYAADQGAFRGWSVIEQVLTVRSRLNVFLEAAASQVSAEEGDAPAEVVEVDAEPLPTA